MRFWCSLSIFIVCYVAVGQNRMAPLSTASKELIFSQNKGLVPLFPMPENVSNFYNMNKDTTVRYSVFGYYLFKRELIQLKDSTAKLWITPAFNLSAAKILGDSTSGLITSNTRGVRVEGSFGEKCTYSTSIYENQAEFLPYQVEFVKAKGERYFNTTTQAYFSDNGVVPGAARTKPFKISGFDYTYAIGNVAFFPSKKWEIHWGNQPMFLGTGHRSMIFSDNSLPLMNNKLVFRPNSKWTFISIHARGFNLLRKKVKTSVESNYEAKLFSINAIYFQPNNNLTIGFIETAVWLRNTAVEQIQLRPLYFSPLPIGATVQKAFMDQSGTKLAVIQAVDANYILGSFRFYGQIAAQLRFKSAVAFQFGLRHSTKNENIQITSQCELNRASINYAHAESSRNYFTNGNLPIAHPLGDNFTELLIKETVRFRKDWFLKIAYHLLPNSVSSYKRLIAESPELSESYQTINYFKAQLAYIFNKHIQSQVFIGFTSRTLDSNVKHETVNWVSIGLKTDLINHYFDF